MYDIIHSSTTVLSTSLLRISEYLQQKVGPDGQPPPGAGPLDKIEQRKYLKIKVKIKLPRLPMLAR